MQQVATVHGIYRYPVKSMRGARLHTTELTFQGVPQDRRYAFVQAGSGSSFPWLTGRELLALLSYETRLDGGDGRPQLKIRAPGQEWRPVDADDTLRDLEERSGRPLILHRDYRGSYDVAQVSLIGQATIARIAEESGTPSEPGRFRANFYLETADGEPFGEDAWVGRVLRIGESARIAVTERDKRCVMITLHPETGVASPEVLRAVARLHDNCAGVYGVVLTPGQVHDGDAVHLE